MDNFSEKENNFNERQFQLPSYRSTNTTGSILFNVYVIAWWLEVGKRIPFLAVIRFEFLLGAVIGLFALNAYIKNADKKSDNGNVIFAALLFLLVLFVSLPLAVNFELAWHSYVDHVIKFALMTFFISQFVVSPQTLVYFLISSFLAFFKIGQEAFYGYFTGYMVWENQGIPRLHGTIGTMFGHPNSLSGKTVSILVFIFYSLKFIKKFWLIALITVQILFSIVIIIYTGSRTGYITFICLLILIIFLSKKKMIFSFIIIAISLISMQFIPEHYKERFMSSFSGTEAQGRSKEARINLLTDSLSVFLENPLGVGLNCFAVVQYNSGRNAQGTHNLYTQLLAETGMQGFFCFAYFIWVMLKKIRNIKNVLVENIKNLNRYRWLNNRLLDRAILNEIYTSEMLLGLTNAVFVFLVLRIILGFFGHDLLEIYWWISAGLVMSLNSILKTSCNRLEEIKSKLNNHQLEVGGLKS